MLHSSIIVGLNTEQTKEESLPGMWTFLRKLLIQVGMVVDRIYSDVGLWSIKYIPGGLV